MHLVTSSVLASSKNALAPSSNALGVKNLKALMSLHPYIMNLPASNATCFYLLLRGLRRVRFCGGFTFSKPNASKVWS